MDKKKKEKIAPVMYDFEHARRMQHILPFTYVANLGLRDNTDLILGMNFILSLQGSLLIEDSTITLFKKTEKISHRPLSLKVATIIEDFREENLEEDIDSIVSINFIKELLEDKEIYTSLLKLEKIGIIGENPVLGWQNSKVICSLEIINLDICITSKVIKPTPADNEDYDMHIKELLHLGVIRKSNSRQRSSAFIVRNHSEIVRGKSRIVYNHKDLNENTYPDQYLLPYIDSLLEKIKNKKYLSRR